MCVTLPSLSHSTVHVQCHVDYFMDQGTLRGYPVDTDMVAGFSACWILSPFSNVLVADIRHVLDSFRAELAFLRSSGLVRATLKRQPQSLSWVFITSILA